MMKSDLEAIVIDQAAQIVKLNESITDLIKQVKKMERLASNYKFECQDLRKENNKLKKQSLLPRGL